MSETPDPAPTPSPRDIVHGLRWGLKASFIDYVQRMPGGRGSVGEGAVPLAGGEFLFTYDGPTAPGEVTAGATQAWDFKGDIRFAGHGGMMFVRIANPRVEVLDGLATLTIEDMYMTEGAPRVPLVRIDLHHRPGAVEPDEGVEVWSSDEVRLTQEGVGLFNDVYAYGEGFEPITIVVPSA